MPEDPLDHGRLLDERNQTQTTATPGTRQNIKPKRAFQQRRPTLTAGLTPRRLGGISLTSRVGGRVFHPRITAVPGRLAPNHLSPPDRRLLTPEQYRVLREHGTERPGTCALLHEKRPGTFSCAGCGGLRYCINGVALTFEPEQ